MKVGGVTLDWKMFCSFRIEFSYDVAKPLVFQFSAVFRAKLVFDLSGTKS